MLSGSIVRALAGGDVQLASRFASLAASAINNAELYEEINRQKTWFESLVEHSPVAIVVEDRSLGVLMWNPAAEAGSCTTMPRRP